jgi:hypothetical protein
VQATSSVSTPAVVSPVPSSFAMEELKSIVLSVGDKLSGQVEDVRNDVNKRLEDADDRLTMFHDRLKDVHEDMAAMQQEVHQMEIRLKCLEEPTRLSSSAIKKSNCRREDQDGVPEKERQKKIHTQMSTELHSLSSSHLSGRMNDNGDACENVDRDINCRKVEESKTHSTDCGKRENRFKRYVNRREMESSESSDTEVSDDSIKSRSSVVKRSPVKPNTAKKFSASLGTYDGSTCLRSFLQKFSYHSMYYGWSDEDKLFQLYSCLTGAAAQMLTCNREVKSVDRILELLETRFGTGNRCEIFRLELKNRRRAPGEKLEVLYQDICRLMSLAYPDPNIDLVDLLARDFYLDALNDHSFKVRILEREPKTLDEALQISLKLEAYDCADPVRNNHSVPVSYQNRNRFRSSCA